MIDRWHRGKGWNGIGYHYVIINDKHDSKADGTVEKGRPDDTSGAHAYGINDRSLGICCIGHGDMEPFTDKQVASLNSLVAKLMATFNIPVSRVIGHRELNVLVEQGKLRAEYKTSKSCPGKKIDMDVVRQDVSASLIGNDNNLEVPANEVNAALQTLNKHKALYPNAIDELSAFLHHPEVIALSD
jgi:N-acetyl-anhydromuramyl-L-alanine amidase AmpD